MTRPLCVVLGAGGARGLAAIGVLKALDEAELAVSHIVGVSMGAVVGAAYCSGMTPDDIEGFVNRFRLGSVVRLSWAGSGVLSHHPLRRQLASMLGNGDFRELSVPLSVVCTDLTSGERVVFRDGPVLPPVLGSCLAIGMFAPVLHQHRWIVDGGYVDAVPIGVAPPDCVYWHSTQPSQRWPILFRKGGSCLGF